MQDAITTLTTLDYVGIFGGVLLGIAAFKTIVTGLEWAGNKLGIRFKWLEDKKADHELLEKTVESVENLEKQLANDEKNHNDEIGTLENKIEELGSEIKNVSEATSNILEKIEYFSERGELYKKSVVELLYETINNQCDHYINELNGIPTDEVSWFSERFELYKQIGGNHGLECKVKYCLEKLPMLPSQD